MGDNVGPIYTLKRVFHSTDRTLGVLMDRWGPFCVTLEDPWRENRRNVSCIPVGNYLCIRTQSPKFGNTFEVKHVENRNHILFHKGNTEEDTKGCILLGESFGYLGSKQAILSSGRAFQEFLLKLRCIDRFLLKIENV